MVTIFAKAPLLRIGRGFSGSVFNLRGDKLCLRPLPNYVTVGREADRIIDEPSSHSLASQFADINLMDMSFLSIFGMVALEQFL